MSLEGKKVACFVALPHHSRFLWPVMEEARKAGAEIQFFTTLSDYPFEREVLLHGVDCRLLQSYANETTRKKIEDTKAAFFDAWTPKLFQWDGMKHWPMVQQSGLLNSGLEEIHCLEAFMEQERPDVLLALHERNRWGKMLGFMARKYNAAYLTFQEGDYYEDRLSFCAHTEYTTALMVWGETTAQRLRRHGVNGDKIVLTGNTHLAQVSNDYFSDAHKAETRRALGLKDDQTVLLFLVGLQWGVISNMELWDDLMEGLPEGVVPLFKWHPKVSTHSFQQNHQTPMSERYPGSILVQNHDPYSLLAIADYCVALGNTTLAREALNFGVPLFSRPGLDGEPDQYADEGIAQSVNAPHRWTALEQTLKDGVPDSVVERVKDYLGEFFYEGNRQAMSRSSEVIHALLEEVSMPPKALDFESEAVPGRVSIIIPSGSDPEAFMGTIVSLAEKVGLQDWEAVVVIHTPGMEALLGQVEGDIRFVHTDEQHLGGLYNEGAKFATGEILIFMRPGLLYYQLDVLQHIDTLTGVCIRNTDMTPYSFGYCYDFNSKPQFNLDDGREPDAQGGGVLAMPRTRFADAGGFDPAIANHLVEADLCLTMQQTGQMPQMQKDAVVINLKETFFGQDDDEQAWRRRIRFYTKWRGKLPKDEDFIAYAAGRMT